MGRTELQDAVPKTVGIVTALNPVLGYKRGFVASDELNPQKARILLTLALMKPRQSSNIQQLFMIYQLESRGDVCALSSLWICRVGRCAWSGFHPIQIAQFPTTAEGSIKINERNFTP